MSLTINPTTGKLDVVRSIPFLNTKYLMLNQVVPQTVSGGIPNFSRGIYLSAEIANNSSANDGELFLSGTPGGYDFDADINRNGATPFTAYFLSLHKKSTDTYPFHVDFLGNLVGNYATFLGVTTPTLSPTAGVLTILGNLTVDNGTYSDNNSTITLTGGLGITNTVLAISSSTTEKTITFPNLTGTPLLTTSGTPTVYMPLCGATANPGVVQSVATGTLGYPLCYNTNASLPSFQILPVAGGGSGRVTGTTAYMPICVGTTATGAQQTVAAGTLAYPLCYNTSGSLPTFQLLTVAGGGTGRATDTAYALIAGGTTTTAAHQSIANSATTGALLRGAGTSALAGWSAAYITEDGSNNFNLTSLGTISLTPTGAGDPYWLSSTGKIGLGGTGLTNNENLLFDFEATANVVAISSTTGVTKIKLTSLDLDLTADDIITDTTTGTKICTAADQKLGFWGYTPANQPDGLTPQLTTITFTAPTPDYAIQTVQLVGYGFATADEGNTVLSVIANLQTRISELESRLSEIGFLGASS